MASTAALGALAGFTIFLGLPVGRLRLLSSPRARRARDVRRRDPHVHPRRRARRGPRDRRGRPHELQGWRGLVRPPRRARPAAGRRLHRRQRRDRRVRAKPAPARGPSDGRRSSRRGVRAPRSRPTSPRRRGRGAPDRADRRRGDRHAQLRRGPRDRRLGTLGRDQPGDDAASSGSRCTTRPRASASSGRSATSCRPGAGSRSPA